MYCPRCSQEKVNEGSKFCSRCGFLMEGMKDVVIKGGLPKAILDQSDPNAISPRWAGVKQGGLLMLSSLILVPLLGILTAIFNGEGFIVGITAIITFWGGFLRILYALIFQSGIRTTEKESFTESVKHTLTGQTQKQKVLPPQQSVPISQSYQPPIGKWRETNDLQPSSVTEEKTQSLNNQEMK